MPKKPTLFSVEPISREFDRESFDCGIEPLNIYIQRYAFQADKKSASRTFILSSPEYPKQIIGYYTLVNSVINYSELPSPYSKKYKPKMPGINLARLAVDKEFQKQNFGHYLLAHALNNIYKVSKITGVAACFVDSKDGARDFYLNYGFIPTTSDKNRFFLPVREIEKLIG